MTTAARSGLTTMVSLAVVALLLMLGTPNPAGAEGFTIQVVVPNEPVAPEPPAANPEPVGESEPGPAPQPTPDPLIGQPGPLPRTGATVGLLAATALAVLASGVAILRRTTHPTPRTSTSFPQE